MMSLFYIKNFIRDANIGSITPTSQTAVKKVCRNIDFDTAKVIVEFGPGGGVFTKYILSKLTPDAKLIAFELNKVFYDFLKQEIKDERFILFNESAENIKARLESEGISDVDSVVSGIPFSFFSIPLKRQITQNTISVLKPGGRFILYQFPPAPLKKEERMSTIFEEEFGNISLGYELLNIPPLIIYEGIKKSIH